LVPAHFSTISIYCSDLEQIVMVGSQVIHHFVVGTVVQYKAFVPPQRLNHRIRHICWIAISIVVF
jgi:hypothetical protein